MRREHRGGTRRNGKQCAHSSHDGPLASVLLGWWQEEQHQRLVLSGGRAEKHMLGISAAVQARVGFEGEHGECMDSGCHQAMTGEQVRSGQLGREEGPASALVAPPVGILAAIYTQYNAQRGYSNDWRAGKEGGEQDGLDVSHNRTHPSQQS